VQTAASSRGLDVVPATAGSVPEIASAAEKSANEGAHAVIFIADSLFTLRRREIADAVLKHRMPAIFLDRENVQAGGLASYGPNMVESYRRSAHYVDKILKGARPAELPVEQPSTYYLALSNRTDKAFGIAIPRELMVRADAVIEW